MRRSRWRSPLVVVATALAMLLGLNAAGAAASVTTPAVANVTPAYVTHSGWLGLQLYINSGNGVSNLVCVDAGGYYNTCQVPGNKYQDWNFVEYEGTPDGNIYKLINQGSPNTCLDSNQAGDVYTTPCQDIGNRYQDWRLDGRPGKTYVTDVYTGYNLTLGSGSYAHGSLATVPPPVGPYWTPIQ